MQPVVIAINRRIESLNNRMKWHWSKRSRERDAWQLEIYGALKGKIRKAKEFRHVTITSIRKRMLDSDNLIGGAKGLRDALTRLGLVVDDSPKWAQFEYHQRKQDMGGEITIIEIYEES